MNSARRLAAVGAVMLALFHFSASGAGPVSARGLTGREATDRPRMLVVEGTLTITGNEPHTRIVVRLNREVAGLTAVELVGTRARELARTHQSQRVTLEVELTGEPVGPGRPATAVIRRVYLPNENRLERK